MDREAAEGGAKEEHGTSEPISLRVPSKSEYALIARLVVSQVGQLAGFNSDDVYDLKLAVTEAATNVIRHAAVEAFDIEYRASPGSVEITITDAGGGFAVEDLTGSAGSEGGFGMAVIRSLVDEVVLSSTEQGTQLKMVRRAAAREKGA